MYIEENGVLWSDVCVCVCVRERERERERETFWVPWARGHDSSNFWAIFNETHGLLWDDCVYPLHKASL